MVKKVLIASSLSALGVLLAASTTMAATISGNGSYSVSSVTSTTVVSSTTTQSNVAGVTNKLKVGSKKTKGNTANYNTGGSVTQTGGDKKVTLNVSTVANSNTNTGDPSCCCDVLPLGDATITGNGDHSNNSVTMTATCVTTLNQSNVASVVNDIHVDSGTGGNTANHNTNTDVNQTNGDSNVDVTVTNVLNSNVSN